MTSVNYVCCVSPINDHRFNGENFGEQPIHIIEAALEKIAEKYQQDANVQATATSRFASAVIHALGGKDTKVEAADFLPFPNAVQGESKISAAGALVISKQTARVFFKLLAEGKLPKEFGGQIGPQVARWKQLAES